MFPRKLVVAAATGLLIHLVGPSVSHGKLLTDAGSARRIARVPSHRASSFIAAATVSRSSVVRKPSFLVGSIIKDPKTLQIRNLEELFRRTTGQVTPNAMLMHGDFTSYWRASYSGRSGKAFEAFEAYRANRRLARMGKGERLLIAAVEPELGAHYPADIVMRNSRGKIVKEFQLKAGAQEAAKAISDSRYAGMTIVTHRDSLERVREDLKKAKLRTVASGRPLHSKWKKIDRALGKGRLTDEMVPGLHTRRLGQIRRVTERYTRNLYENAASTMSKYAPKTSKVVGLSARGTAKVGSRLIPVTSKIAGKVFVVTDIGFIGWQTYGDVQRFRAGELSGGLLATKSALHGGELAVAVSLLLIPEPTTKVVAVCIVVGVVLVGTDASLDAYNDTSRRAARNLLESIDHDERFHAARRQLLRELEAMEPIQDGAVNGR